MAVDGMHPAALLRARSRARRCALQALYQWQLTGDSPTDLIRQFHEGDELKKADAGYFEQLVIDCLRENESLLAQIAGTLDRPVDQLDPIERAALIIGVYELRDRAEVPYRVAISEAVELAKSFGGTDGHKYVNAVLDRAARVLRPAETGS